VFVCLSVCSHISKTTWPNFNKFFVHVACDQARSSGGVAITYVLPVLWMTFFSHNEPYGVLCVFLSGRSRNLCIDAN